MKKTISVVLYIMVSGLALPVIAQNDNQTCRISLYVLGNAQDAGKPQIGQHQDPAWQDPSRAQPATALALYDKGKARTYLFDATPDIKAQLYALDQHTGKTGFALDGIFLTHAHIGHYLGLAQLGREAMGANAIPVYAMPKMRTFLRENGPWNLLVRLKNIVLIPLVDQQAVDLDGGIVVTPLLAPHRAEYTETVGFSIATKHKSAFYLPDIDRWDDWGAMGTTLEAMIAAHDLLFLDATFYSGNELPGRDMSKIPHPTITTTMARLEHLSAAQKNKVHFIHLNHSNPAHNHHSKAYKAIKTAGFNVAQTGDTHCLN